MITKCAMKACVQAFQPPSGGGESTSVVVPCLGIISIESLAFSMSLAGGFSEKVKREGVSDGKSSPLESPQHDEQCISERDMLMLQTWTCS